VQGPSIPAKTARWDAHDPEKLVLDLIGDGNRFSDKIMRNQ
jgi:hypothetical protein